MSIEDNQEGLCSKNPFFLYIHFYNIFVSFKSNCDRFDPLPHKMTEESNHYDVKGKKKSSGSSGGGFQGMGLSEEVYRGVVKMGFRVSNTKQLMKVMSDD